MKASRAWSLAALVPCLSLLVTRPWNPGAFPVWDYAELLPLLRASHGFWGAVQTLAHFNRADGRANYLAYAQFALSWGVAGDHPVGWQWQRAIFMLGAAALLVLAAALSGLLFCLAVPSTEGWLFLMGEPLALMLLLLFVLAAAGYRGSYAWRSRALLLALLAGLVMLTKEVLGVCLPLLVLFALCWEPDGFQRPRFGARERWLFGCLLVVLLLEALSVRAALHDAVPQGYASAYGSGTLGLGRLATLFQAMLLPTRFVSAGAATLLYPANLAFLLVLVLGLAQPASGTLRPRGWGWWPAGLLAFPLIGALTYALWPRYSAFYGIPFFAASAGLFLAAASWIERSHRVGRWVALVLGIAAIGYSAMVADRVIREKHALSALAVMIAQSFSRAPRLDTLLLVSPRQGGRRWPVSARGLGHYAVAIGEPDSVLPVMREAPCEDIARRLGRPLGRNAILNDQNPCGPLPSRTFAWRTEIRYRDWVSFAPLRDTVQVEILAPSWKR